MRKVIIILGSIVGAIVVAVVAVFFYAAANLNSIIAANRDRLLNRASDAIGRKVEAHEIKAQIGWGVSADISGVSVADDPTFSTKPFVQASDVFAKLEFMPLLTRQIRITSVILNKPEIRIIRNDKGQLNVTTIGHGKQKAEPPQAAAPSGKKLQGGQTETSPMAEAPAKEAKKRGIVRNLHVRNFAMQGGVIIFQDYGAPEVKVTSIDVDVENFSLTSAFRVSMALAALGSDRQNVKLAGDVGPLMTGGAIDVGALPLNLKLTAGPFALDQMRKMAMLAKAIPPKLAVSDSVSLTATAAGTLDALKINAATDLTSNQVAFGDSFDKPSGTPLKVTVDATRTGSELGVALAQVTLGEMRLKATKISFGGGKFAGRIDTNQFDIAQMAKLAPAAAKQGITGNAEIHSNVQYAGGKPTANGTITLAGVAVPKPGGQGMAISGLSGDIRLAGSAADIGPLAFKLGTGSATLKGRADPIYPVNLTYALTADAIRTADFVKDRPADEQLNRVNDSGSLTLKAFGPDIENKLISPSGSLDNIAYSGLNLTTSLEGKRLRVMDLRVQAFSGTVAATAETQLAPSAPFKTSVSMANINVQQALASQKLKAANMVQGILSGRADLSGKTGKFDEMKQTFLGNGRFQLMQGKLIGINVAATGLKKVDKIPGVGKLVPDSVVNNHPELFNNPDTDIESASLSFDIKGPRITSHDLVVKTVDYSLNGDGWFDMDKNIDMNARILLTPQLTREIVEQKSAVIYVTNKNKQVDIPLRITGQLPKPIVVPDVTEIAQRAGQRAIEQKGQEALGKFLGKKGLGKFLGGDSGGSGSGGGTGGGSGSQPSEPKNPLEQFKKFF